MVLAYCSCQLRLVILLSTVCYCFFEGFEFGGGEVAPLALGELVQTDVHDAGAFEGDDFVA